MTQAAVTRKGAVTRVRGQDREVKKGSLRWVPPPSLSVKAEHAPDAVEGAVTTSTQKETSGS